MTYEERIFYISENDHTYDEQCGCGDVGLTYYKIRSAINWLHSQGPFKLEASLEDLANLHMSIIYSLDSEWKFTPLEIRLCQQMHKFMKSVEINYLPPGNNVVTLSELVPKNGAPRKVVIMVCK